MSVVRLWVCFDTKNLSPPEVRQAFIGAVRDAVATAQSQGRLERIVADQLRYALMQHQPVAE